MAKIKELTDFLASLKTSIWLIMLLLICMFAGAFVMPARKEFQSIHGIPLFEWMIGQPLVITWWLWGAIIVIAVTVINTLFCSVDSIVKKRKATRWLLLISPQVIHIGFLLILFAHLLDAFGSYKDMTPAAEGSVVKISANEVVKIKDIRTRISSGYISDWEVAIEIYRNGFRYNSDVMRPNKPSIQPRYNIIVKDLRVYPSKAVLLQVSREPGALWALAGGILFMAGIAILIVLKVRIER
jgi:ribosomal protein S8